MADLGRQRCFHHAQREAAARCPECGRFYCRECVTEHEGRVLCADCLGRLLKPIGGGPRTRPGFRLVLHLLWGSWLTWIFFYYLGQAWLRLPTSFHEGTIWREVPW